MNRKDITLKGFSASLKKQVKVLAAEKGIKITQMFERLVKIGLETFKKEDN